MYEWLVLLSAMRAVRAAPCNQFRNGSAADAKHEAGACMLRNWELLWRASNNWAKLEDEEEEETKRESVSYARMRQVARAQEWALRRGWLRLSRLTSRDAHAVRTCAHVSVLHAALRQQNAECTKKWCSLSTNAQAYTPQDIRHKRGEVRVEEQS